MNRNQGLLVGAVAGLSVGIAGTFAMVSERYVLEEKSPAEEYVTARLPLVSCFYGEGAHTLSSSETSERADSILGPAVTETTATKDENGYVTARIVYHSRVQEHFGGELQWIPYRSTHTVAINAAGVLETVTQGVEVQHPNGNWVLSEDLLFHGSPGSALQWQASRAPAFNDYVKDGASGFSLYVERHHYTPLERKLGCTLPRPSR